ncbi:hypothetical protein LXL04_036842 [Taraxacum kok-saghyz]
MVECMKKGSVQGYFSPVNQDLGGFEPPTSQEMIPSALTISELTDLYQHHIMKWSGAGRLRVGVEVKLVAFASEWRWSPSRRIAGVATPEIVAGRFKPQRERGWKLIDLIL